MVQKLMMLIRALLCVLFSVLVSTNAVRADASLAGMRLASTAGASSELPMADRVLVRKSERKLYLYHRGVIVREYPVRLGLQPEGPKQYEGDYRTPEGRYHLGRRNPQSQYFLSVQVDYPNERDIARAKKLKEQPGGAIMVHGLPNTPTKVADYYKTFDWTDGCIALNNSDMVEFWLMTRAGIPIDIQP